MNYIPKSVTFDELKITQSISSKIQTINEFVSFCYSREFVEFSTNNRYILKVAIEKLAKGFYLDGKKIIISSTGGYSGCPDKMVDTIKLKNTFITNLKFCYGCINWNRGDYFIETFNSKMYKLMKIKAPDYATYRFKGEFVNKKNKSEFTKLILNQDRSFQLFKSDGNYEKVYSGFWENEKFILTLDLSKYIELKDLKLEYNISRRKLVGLTEKNVKFKKEENI